MREKCLDVCCITETWLKASDGALLAEIRDLGYDIISCPRKGGKGGGGVAFMHSKNVIAKNIKIDKYKTFEVQQVVVSGSNENIRFSTIYRTGYMNSDEKDQYFTEMDDYVNSLLDKDGYDVIWGDLNIHVEEENNVTAIELLDIMEYYGYTQLVNTPTQIAGGTLDVLFIREGLKNLKFEVHDNQRNVPISDHFLITLSIPLLLHASVGSRIEYSCRDLHSIDEKQFTANLKNALPSLESFVNYDADGKVNALNTCLLETLNQEAPIEVKSRKISKHIVCNVEIQNARRRRRRAERRLKKSGLERDRNELKSATKAVTKIVKSSIDAFYQNKFAAYECDAKQTYKMVNKLLYKDSKRILPTHSDPSELAEKFETYYENKVTDIQSEISAHSDISVHHIPNQLNNSDPDSNSLNSKFTTFSLMSPEEILEIVHDLANKHCDLDSVPSSVFKGSIEGSLSHITEIVNSSLIEGCFPDALKKALVTPILKDHDLDSDLLKNYRPVSNLSLISKIIEKCVLKQLIKHLEKNDLLAKLQTAYRKHHSCETALLKIYDDLLTVIDAKNNIILVMLDFSSAFDTINQELLLQKLKKQYGLDKAVLKWFDSYLNNRSFMVKIKDQHSKGRLLRYGVPQGSILGPILFILYVKDLEDIAAKNGLCSHMFADDSQLYLSYNEATSLSVKGKVENCLKEFKNWTDYHLLKLNSSKTKVINIMTNRSNISPLDISFNGSNVEVHTSVKNLGFHFDNMLTMKKHINKVCSSGYFMLKNLWHIASKVTSVKLKTQLVHGCILSKIDYCNSLYYGLPNNLIHKLQKLMNAAVRFIYNLTGPKRRLSISPFLKKVHFLPVKTRIDYKIALLTFKGINNQAPQYLQNLINLKSPNESLRSSTDIMILDYPSMERSEYKRRRFSYASPTVWNHLPMKLRNMTSLQEFKKQLKTFYFAECFNNID